MKNITKLTITEIKDLQPTAVQYAGERGEVLGGIEVSGEIDHAEVAAKVAEYFGSDAVADGEGNDGDECVHWVVINPAK